MSSMPPRVGVLADCNGLQPCLYYDRTDDIWTSRAQLHTIYLMEIYISSVTRSLQFVTVSLLY
jgi:hypothetical protein